MVRLARSTALAVVTLLIGAAAARAAEPFPRDFFWATAISGFQAEMGGSPDQRDTASDWWAWSHDERNLREGRIVDLPENGAGHWNRYAEDVRLAKREVGANMFRIGLEWSRIFPRSTRGASSMEELDALADQAAVAHYRDVLLEVRAAGMEPFVTINHFTLPLWVHDPIEARKQMESAGLTPDLPPPACTCPRGWLDTATIDEFAKYSAYLAWKLGDLVRYWNPMNEPMIPPLGGYINVPELIESDFPPGILSWEATRQAILNTAEAWSRSYDELHRRDADATVVLVHNMAAYHPDRPGNALDERGARHADQFFNRMFPDMVVRGHVDENMDGRLEEHERNRRGRKVDVFGLNYYFRARVVGLPAATTTRIPLLDFLPKRNYAPEDCPSECDDLGREIFPPGLREVTAIAGEYGIPVMVTENGMADADDDRRPRYLADHIRVLRKAMADGVADVRGYFVWALIDNYEWNSGFPPKFGIYGFRPGTTERVPRPGTLRTVSCIFKTGRLDRCAEATARPRRCVSRRRFRIRLSRRLARASVTVAGRRVRVTRRRGRLVATVDLRGRPVGSTTVRIRGRTRAGAPHRSTRRYRTCAR